MQRNNSIAQRVGGQNRNDMELKGKGSKQFQNQARVSKQNKCADTYVKKIRELFPKCIS